MSTSNTTPVRSAGNNRILTIDWSLLFKRLGSRARQVFSSARHKAAQTEYIPPTWMQRFHLSWFRLGLIGIALFVFTQKQIDFTVSVGKEGLAIGANEGRHMAAKSGAEGGKSGMMSMLPALFTSGSAPEAAPAAASAPAWNVANLDRAAVRAYISRFEKVAQGEERKYSIPAAANMALAIIQSNAGKSTAATAKNNHFFPATPSTYYENAWMNWRSHSEMIAERFPQLASESVNYQQWIAALAKTNYSRDPELANKVMDVVEQYQLERL